MALLMLRLKPAQRYLTSLAALQRMLGLADTADIDPGIVLGVVPDTIDMDALAAVFRGKPVNGVFQRLEVQKSKDTVATVMLFGGDVAEVLQDFETFSMVKDFGGSAMTLALQAADAELTEQVSRQAADHVMVFDSFEASDLDSGAIVLDLDLGDDDPDDTSDEN